MNVMECCSSLGAASLTLEEAQATAAVLKALGDPHRLRMVNLLATSPEPVCVCEITDAVGLAQPTVSFHLKKLVAAGLLRRQRRGTWAYYSVDDDALERVADAMHLRKEVS
ncbi:MAG: metalloregulator ArsR/SmtB family transcription factor [Actinomycetota bacterium]|nr:metalloregulator ArsR/SmtB family transcription factor [Actinomycetota bacterium]